MADEYRNKQDRLIIELQNRLEGIGDHNVIVDKLSCPTGSRSQEHSYRVHISLDLKSYQSLLERAETCKSSLVYLVSSLHCPSLEYFDNQWIVTITIAIDRIKEFIAYIDELYPK